MKNIRSIKLYKSFILGLVLILAYGCERDVTDEAVPATFSNVGDVFTDSPIGLGEDFYFPYGDSNFEVINFEGTDAFEGNSSIQVSVPNEDDPNGNYAGGIFRVDGAGRDLTGFDALTFYAKASQGVVIDQIGFGEDFLDNKYQTTLVGVSIGTGWAKYIIPIPDPSKLTEVRGLFRYAAGTQNTGGFGYTLWFDEIKFEKLGTIGQPRPRIFNGQSLSQESFLGSTTVISGLSFTANLANGINQTVVTTPSYFNFLTSNPSVATVSELGVISTDGVGTATITASLGGEVAEGSIELNSVGAFPSAPVPSRDAANVISLFSDAYSNVPVRHYNGFFQFATTQGGAGADPNNVDLQVPVPGGGVDNIISYTELNFVSIGTYETVPLVDISAMTNLHVDINVREDLGGGDFLRLSMESGTGTGSTSFGSVILSVAELNNVDENGWLSLDIPISNFAGFTNPSALGQLFFVSDATISNIWVDNVYFYNE